MGLGLTTGYTSYLAVERAGSIEDGFHPATLLSPGNPVYYAKAVARVVGFLGLLRDVADHQKVNPAAISFGVAFRGTKGVDLACITQRVDQVMFRQFVQTTPPDSPNYLFLRPAEA